MSSFTLTFAQALRMVTNKAGSIEAVRQAFVDIPDFHNSTEMISRWTALFRIVSELSVDPSQTDHLLVRCGRADLAQVQKAHKEALESARIRLHETLFTFSHDDDDHLVWFKLKYC